MARMPRDNSGPRVPWPAPRAPWPSFYRSGDTCRSTRALTAHPARSVHEGCASVARRGTDLLAGRGTARTATAGTGPPSGERADGGLRTGRGPGTGEATPTNAPVGPFTRHGGLARPFPDDLLPAPCPLRGCRRPWHARGPARFTRGKATVRMTSLHSQRSTWQTPRPIARQATRTTRSAGRPATPGPAVAPGQRRNVPAGRDRGL
jgi:hypothetical protein